MESAHSSTCDCSNASNLASQLGTSEFPASLDDILNVTQRFTELWPHLKACANCFPQDGKSRTKDLLIAYDVVVGALEASADVFLGGHSRSPMTLT